MSTAATGRSRDASVSLIPRWLGRVTTWPPRERRAALLFSSYAFLLLFCYYVLKVLREPLLLAGGSAELKSYAQGAIAIVLMVLVPLYGALFRRTSCTALVRAITALFAASLAVFYVLGRLGLDIGFAYYVFVGVFGVTMIAQFWAHAAHTFDVATGQRLFPLIMAGATLGGLASPPLVAALFPHLGAWNLILLATALLLATGPLVAATRQAVPVAARNPKPAATERAVPLRNGFALVLHDRYLLLLAALVVVLNCVNTTGEYLLTELMLRRADVALDPGAFIADFYGDYYFVSNALAVALQLLVVGRLFRSIGVHGALLIPAAIALLGYGLAAFLPIFALIRCVKIVENGVDYSIMNTTRQALYLPLSATQQFQGKTTIDGFFWRLGDVLQAAAIFVGLHWFGFGITQFAALNFALALVWLALATRLAGHYHRATAPHIARRRVGVRVMAAAVGLAAATAVARAAADPAAPPAAQEIAASDLFAERSPLDLELTIDETRFCRNPQVDSCEDAPGALHYRAADGEGRVIAVTLRARGRWRKDTADCRLPALFVFFDAATAAGTPFAGQHMLPLTTHCRDATSYEQNVLKEYLAYRIYEQLTDKSLRTRLARVTYRSLQDPGRTTQRYAFFTEHFDALARRHGADVWRPESLDLGLLDAQELASLAVFQYLIGNTDWSAVYGHNVVAIRTAAGAISAVPFDFDFSGLVAADYAGPPPGLPIRTVTQRIFRGFCEPKPDWDAVFAALAAERQAILDLPDTIPALTPGERARTRSYLDSFYALLDDPERRATRIVAACRAAERLGSAPAARRRAVTQL